jgi:NAD(P)-dependent dehydrogenase (short-subunit alcohol dehydrogenase family)
VCLLILPVCGSLLARFSFPFCETRAAIKIYPPNLFQGSVRIINNDDNRALRIEFIFSSLTVVLLFGILALPLSVNRSSTHSIKHIESISSILLPSIMTTSSDFLTSFLGLDGKVALITGSTAGLGRAMAEVLLQAGCKVVINGRNPERTQTAVDEIRTSIGLLENATGGGTTRVLAAAGDTSEPQAAQAIIEKIQSTYGRLDIVVNNAGVNLPEGSFEEQYSSEQWEKISRVNIQGPMNISYAALALLKKSPAGRIINVSSMIGHVGDAKNPLYTMTKSAILMFTKSLAVDLAGGGNTESQNITVNSISPGIFSTDMNAKFTQDPEALQKVENTIPMRRLGKPKELAGAVLYLASDAASYTTGGDILVDGGFVAV